MGLNPSAAVAPAWMSEVPMVILCSPAELLG